MEKRNGEVITEKGNKWSNLEYFNLTGLREYAPYMMGGGCVPDPLARSAARVLPVMLVQMPNVRRAPRLLGV